MCDATITPQIAHEDKLPLGARLFIEGKNRPLHVVETINEIHDRLASNDPAISVTNLNGEQTLVPVGRVVSVVAPTPSGREKIELSGGEFCGSAVHVVGLTQQRLDEFQGPLGNVDLQGQDLGLFAVVIGEDMGYSEIAIVEVATGRVAWANPAEPERGIRRAVKLVRLAAEMKVLIDAEYAPTGA